jgi:hypothetical protein
MSFGETAIAATTTATTADVTAQQHNSNDPNNQSRDDDGNTHNTSISSLSGDGGHRRRRSTTGLGGDNNDELPPAILEWKSRQGGSADETDAHPVTSIHQQLFSDEDNFGYSDDDDDDDFGPESPGHGLVGRTRLNFNMVLSPEDNNKKANQEEKVPGT